MRGIVIAGTHSGCGKTTAALGIMAALRKKGLIVQPFKTGPDFIDAGLHRLAVDRLSRNLDPWMCGQKYVTDCFRTYASGADIAVIEGVMGLYDGEFGTASLARLLGAPVLLVIDSYGMAESAGAMVKGFTEFGDLHPRLRVEPRVQGVHSPEFKVKFAGVIFNRVGSEKHYKRLKESVRGVPVLGYLPRERDFEIPHRHLGLTTAEEDPITRGNIEKLADTVLQHIDIESLLKSAECPASFSFQGEGRDNAADESVLPRSHPDVEGDGKFRIALAYDRAFCFYYEDNIDLLSAAGAEIIRFSPTADSAVPDKVDGVYLGGGYPELYADALSRNTAMLASIREWSDAGKPIYAECGGLMYLSQAILDFDNRLFPMAGVFPFRTRMIKKPRLAYREVRLNQDCILGKKGELRRGHEFHYSEIAAGETPGTNSAVFSVRDKNGAVDGDEGFSVKNTLASYIHIHFGSSGNIADRFAEFVKGEKTG